MQQIKPIGNQTRYSLGFLRNSADSKTLDSVVRYLAAKRPADMTNEDSKLLIAALSNFNIPTSTLRDVAKVQKEYGESKTLALIEVTLAVALRRT